MKLEENKYYHIYHRGVNKADIFFNPADYALFLDKYLYYLYLSADTLAYCLIPNHFHAIIKIRPIEEQKRLFDFVQSTYPTESFHGDVYHSFKPYKASVQMGHFLNSYTKLINNKYEREGLLFNGRFKRIEIDSEEYMSYLICYIHRNPIHHGISNSYESYPYSSFCELFSDAKSFINRKAVFEVLGGKENAKAAHDEVRLKIEDKYLLEDI